MCGGDKEELSFWPWREGGGTPFLKTPPINRKHIWDTYIRYLPIFPLHFVLLNISADLFAAAITVSINISFSLTSWLSLQLLNSLLLKSTSTYNVFLQNNFVEFFSYFFFFAFLCNCKKVYFEKLDYNSLDYFETNESNQFWITGTARL